MHLSLTVPLLHTFTLTFSFSPCSLREGLLDYQRYVFLYLALMSKNKSPFKLKVLKYNWESFLSTVYSSRYVKDVFLI